MQEPDFKTVALDMVVASLTNPRKTFNQAKLEELATSIQASGVHQPVLVRPLPQGRMQETFRDRRKGAALPAYELVAGERRLRASHLAKVETIPIIARHLTDAQVLEIQIIENLQREDLSPLEEAEGYEALMQHSHFDTEQVAEKIGKSRSYVYARLKLLDLCQTARVALRDGQVDASRALLVARIPDEKLQIKAMKEIAEGHYSYASNGKEPMSYRAAAQHIQQNYMLKLSDARFKIADADLLPEAGNCKTCTKRTGHDPELFSDVKGADVCTDPTCFHRKEDAQARRVTAEAKAKGQTVIAGKAAGELAHGYDNKFKGYRRLDITEDSPTNVPLRKIVGDIMKAEGIQPVLIENPRKKGDLVACLPNEVALKLLKMAEATAQVDKGASKEVKQLVDDKKAKAEQKAKARFEQGWRDELVASTWRALKGEAQFDPFDTALHRMLLVREARGLSVADAEMLCGLLDLGKVSPVSAVVDYAKECVAPEVLHPLIIMVRDSSKDDHVYGGVQNEGLMVVARNIFGGEDGLQEEIKRIKLEVKAKVWPKSAKTASTDSPAARPSADARKGRAQKTAPARAAKLSAQEASLGIADAMQSLEDSGDGAAAMPGAAVAAQSNEPLAQHAGQGHDTPDTDELFEKASSVIRKAQEASVRLLKTELGIGTKRAMDLMAALESAGQVSAADGRHGRKVLVAA